jgi:holo-[acyl-carrier protein] synthase
MILGVGTDIAAIDRIERMIDRYGDAFLRKVFTPAEIEYCSRKARPAIHFAGRWSAKEAFYKALPDRCQRRSSWKSVEIVPAPDERRPAVSVLSDLLREALAFEKISAIHVSISHEHHACVAVVVLEKGAEDDVLS